MIYGLYKLLEALPRILVVLSRFLWCLLFVWHDYKPTVWGGKCKRCGYETFDAGSFW